MEQEIEEEQLPLDVTGDETPAEPAAAEGEPAPSGEEPAAESAKKGKIQERFNELTRLRRDAERDADYWRGRAEASEAGQNIPQTEEVVEQPTASGEMPLLNDYDTEAEYKTAMSSWVKAQVDAGIQQGNQQLTQANKNAARIQKMQEAAATRPEIMEPRYAELPLTETILDAADGDNFVEIIYELGSNPAELGRIASLPLAQQVKEVMKIETRLTAKPPQKIKPDAPDPPEYDIGPGVGSPQPKKLEDMSTKEKLKKWDNDLRKEKGLPPI